MSNSDVVLEDGVIRITGGILQVDSCDLCLDASDRRSQKHKDRPRRALVHDFNDGLTLNWDHDYPGGIAMRGPVTADKGLLVEGDIILVTRKTPPPLPQDPNATPDTLADLAASRPMSSAVLAGPLRQKSLKERAAKALGGVADDYTVTELSELQALLHRLQAEIAELKKKIEKP